MVRKFPKENCNCTCSFFSIDWTLVCNFSSSVFTDHLQNSKFCVFILTIFPFFVKGDENLMSSFFNFNWTIAWKEVKEIQIKNQELNGPKQYLVCRFFHLSNQFDTSSFLGINLCTTEHKSGPKISLKTYVCVWFERAWMNVHLFFFF